MKELPDDVIAAMPWEGPLPIDVRTALGAIPDGWAKIDGEWVRPHRQEPLPDDRGHRLLHAKVKRLEDMLDGVSRYADLCEAENGRLAYAVDALLDAYDEEQPDAVAEIVESLREIRSW